MPTIDCAGGASPGLRPAKSPSALAATRRLMRDVAAIATALTAERAAFLGQLARPEAAAFAVSKA